MSLLSSLSRRVDNWVAALPLRADRVVGTSCINGRASKVSVRRLARRIQKSPDIILRYGPPTEKFANRYALARHS